jgi:hypothetical protein
MSAWHKYTYGVTFLDEWRNLQEQGEEEMYEVKLEVQHHRESQPGYDKYKDMAPLQSPSRVRRSPKKYQKSDDAGGGAADRKKELSLMNKNLSASHLRNGTLYGAGEPVAEPISAGGAGAGSSDVGIASNEIDDQNDATEGTAAHGHEESEFESLEAVDGTPTSNMPLSRMPARKAAGQPLLGTTVEQLNTPPAQLPLALTSSANRQRLSESERQLLAKIATRSSYATKSMVHGQKGAANEELARAFNEEKDDTSRNLNAESAGRQISNIAAGIVSQLKQVDSETREQWLEEQVENSTAADSAAYQYYCDLQEAKLAKQNGSAKKAQEDREKQDNQCMLQATSFFEKEDSGEEGGGSAGAGAGGVMELSGTVTPKTGRGPKRTFEDINAEDDGQLAKIMEEAKARDAFSTQAAANLQTVRLLHESEMADKLAKNRLAIAKMQMEMQAQQHQATQAMQAQQHQSSQTLQMQMHTANQDVQLRLAQMQQGMNQQPQQRDEQFPLTVKKPS